MNELDKSSMLNYVERRLSEWAEWFSHGNFYGLGYPKSSIEHRLMVDGHIIRSSLPNPLPVNEEAEEIEDLVVEMSSQNLAMAQALRCFYFTSGGLRKKANKVNISHMQFKYYVDMGHQWLAGRLTAEIRKH